MKTLSLAAIILTATITTLFGQRSGIYGKVTQVTGNQMPTTDAKQKNTVKVEVKEIFIYEITSQKQATKEGAFYKNITTHLVVKKKTKPDGSFNLKLKPGRYSVFIKENEGLFANSTDGEGNINVITVEPKKMTAVDLLVDYKAAY